MEPMNQTQAPDIEQVLKHNAKLLKRHVARRLALAISLMALPLVLNSLGVPNTFLLVLPIPFGMWLLIFLALRVGHGRRLNVCRKVLHTYPLEYRTRVERKRGDRNGDEWKYLGTIHTIKLSTRGRHGAPACGPSTPRRCGAGPRVPRTGAPGSPVIRSSAASWSCPAAAP